MVLVRRRSPNGLRRGSNKPRSDVLLRGGGQRGSGGQRGGGEQRSGRGARGQGRGAAPVRSATGRLRSSRGHRGSSQSRAPPAVPSEDSSSSSAHQAPTATKAIGHDLILTDVQDLLLKSVTGSTPRRFVYSVNNWQAESITVLCLENLTPRDLRTSLQQPSVNCSNMFNFQASLTDGEVEIFCNIEAYQSQVKAALISAGMSAIEQLASPTLCEAFGSEQVIPLQETFSPADPRQYLHLPSSALTSWGLPLGELKHTYCHYLKAQNKHILPTHHSKLFAWDCEIVKTVEGLEAYSISFVDEGGTTVVDHLIQPDGAIDKSSNRVAEVLENVTLTRRDVIRELSQVLPPDAILISHDSTSDISAFRLSHPYHIDTQSLFCLAPGLRANHSLKHLTKAIFNKDIQKGNHKSDEDALWTMRLLQKKLELGTDFGEHAKGFRIQTYRSSQGWAPLTQVEMDRLAGQVIPQASAAAARSRSASPASTTSSRAVAGPSSSMRGSSYLAPQASARSRSASPACTSSTSNRAVAGPSWGTSGSRHVIPPKKRRLSGPPPAQPSPPPQDFFSSFSSVKIVANPGRLATYKTQTGNRHSYIPAKSLQNVLRELEADAPDETLLMWGHTHVQTKKDRQQVATFITRKLASMKAQSMFMILTSGRCDESGSNHPTKVYRGGLVFSK